MDVFAFYEMAEKACSNVSGSGGAPEYSIEMPIATESAEEYVSYVQFVAAAVSCLGFVPCRFYVDGVFCVDFFPTHQMKSNRFRIEFPVVERDELGGRYGFGGEVFDDAFRLVVFGPRAEYCKMAVGDFSSFRRLGD